LRRSRQQHRRCNNRRDFRHPSVSGTVRHRGL